MLACPGRGERGPERGRPLEGHEHGEQVQGVVDGVTVTPEFGRREPSMGVPSAPWRGPLKGGLQPLVG